MNYPAWQIKTADPAAEQALAGAGCGALLRRVLAARGCTDPAEVQALLGAGAELSDPFLLRDMDKAVARIEQAVENEETIVIYGDYDVDGISATAILYECLSSMGAHVRCKLPTRGTGYGLTRPALESLAEKGFKLVVTVDNGISAIEEAACAKELGLDLIVTDHHLPGETLPDAVAVVDPKRADDESPFKDLCGAGVAFKLCAALEGLRACGLAGNVRRAGGPGYRGRRDAAGGGEPHPRAGGTCPFAGHDAPRPAGVDGKRRGRGQARHRGHRQLQPGPAAERSGPHG